MSGGRATAVDPAQQLAAVRDLLQKWSSVEEVDEWSPLDELRAALDAPSPRKPRSAPSRDDVLAYYRLAVGEGDGHESAFEQAIDYALSYADEYEVPRWDKDPIVLRFGWLDGRCGRCGEELPTVEVSR